MRPIFTVFLLLAAELCLAQGMMIPQTSTIRTPHGNVSTTTYHYMPMPMNSKSSSSVKYQFTVVLSDTSVNVKSRIDFSGEKHSIKVKTPHGDWKYTPSSTKEIFRTTSEGRRITGIPADSCWLFKSVEGKINTYSYLPELGYTYVIAVQDGDAAPIVTLTKENLEAIVGNLADPKVIKFISKNKLIEAVELYNKGN